VGLSALAATLVPDFSTFMVKRKLCFCFVHFMHCLKVGHFAKTGSAPT
jgi:hypothetical protein